MRPLFAIILAAAIIFGVQAFISASARAKVDRSHVVEVAAEGKFQVEMLLTFDAAPDSFSLDDNESPSVLLEQRGKTVFQSSEDIQAGKILVVDAPDIVEGGNEFYLTSHPADDDDPDLIRAARVRILRDGESVAEKWITSEPGLAAEGDVFLDVPKSKRVGEEHDH